MKGALAIFLTEGGIALFAAWAWITYKREGNHVFTVGVAIMLGLVIGIVFGL